MKKKSQSFVQKTKKRFLAILLSGTILGSGFPAFGAEPVAPTPSGENTSTLATPVWDGNIKISANDIDALARLPAVVSNGLP